MPGILAIWNDIDDAFAQTYERWIVSEHIPERLAVPGFLEARRYEAVRGGPRIFIPYLVASPEVLSSPAYLARLAAPTPLTRETMAGFRNMTRSACALAYRSPGPAIGAYAVTGYAQQPVELDASALMEDATASARDPRVVRAQVWRSMHRPGEATSSEAKLRPGGDRGIEAALVVEVMREADALALQDVVHAAMRRSLREKAGGEPAQIRTAVYRLLGLWRARDADERE
jgi:hypothetical protein